MNKEFTNVPSSQASKWYRFYGGEVEISSKTDREFVEYYDRSFRDTAFLLFLLSLDTISPDYYRNLIDSTTCNEDPLVITAERASYCAHRVGTTYSYFASLWMCTTHLLGEENNARTQLSHAPTRLELVISSLLGKRLANLAKEPMSNIVQDCALNSWAYILHKLMRGPKADRNFRIADIIHIGDEGSRFRSTHRHKQPDSYNYLSWISNLETSLEADLSGQTIIVTGSNTGLGSEAVKHLASMNPERIIIACRDTAKGEKVKEEIVNKYEVRVEVWKLDLSSFASVIDFAKRYETTGWTLHVLVSNAGVALAEWTFTDDGFETTLQVNHIANLLLILKLLPSLKKAKTDNFEPRVVVVASDVHGWTKFPEHTHPDPIAALNDPKRTVTIGDRYNVSKLLNVYMTRYLGPILKKEGVSIHCLTPGFCYSELIRNTKGVQGIFFAIFRFIMARSTEEGSRTLVHAAVHEDLLMKNGPSGRYWLDCKELSPAPLAIDKKIQEKVMRETLDIIKKIEMLSSVENDIGMPDTSDFTMMQRRLALVLPSRPDAAAAAPAQA
ncbi:short-chain dehydrogenase [Planoprotostelium fungivorum]|uniref:Short-chain dehydrogenase n=1 Tax=Planoprotostelium fungivorum TaxID=1890364 RepID=A0A2P6NYE7_9EUKA|nr:short-chain dehydrogenase [Planoprotostelium fungivorum]